MREGNERKIFEDEAKEKGKWGEGEREREREVGEMCVLQRRE